VVLADVYESDLADVRLNIPVDVRVAAYPRRTIPAHIISINPTVDPTTRTVRVRCLVQNTEGLLKPDMFATIKIRSLPPDGAVVPVSAVLSQGQETVIFVEEEPGRFHRRQIQPGREMQGYIIAHSGVRSGERVVSRGVLMLSALFNRKAERRVWSSGWSPWRCTSPCFCCCWSALFIASGIVAFKTLPIEAFPDVTDVQVS